MPTTYTTIVPTAGSDPVELYNSIIKKEFIVLIVLGDDALSRNTQVLAESVANQDFMGYKKRILWVKDTNLLKTKLDKLIADSGTFNEPLNKYVVLAVSYENNLRDVILRTEPIIDVFRVDSAFSNAVLNED